jgi:DNA-binding NarL/FixJ family response regulator
MSANTRITLLVAYRHTLLRQALRAVLATHSDMHVVAEAGDGKAAVEIAGRLGPDVAVMDTRLPIVSGVAATRLIRRPGGHTRVLLLAVGVDDELVLTMLRAGAAGCLLEDADLDELVLAIRTVHGGGSYLSPRISERMVRDHAGAPASTNGAPLPRELLSTREREVLQLFANGQGNTAIAKALVLSVKTVEAHKAHISQKLRLKGGVALLKYAARHGMIELDAGEPVAELAPSA